MASKTKNAYIVAGLAAALIIYLMSTKSSKAFASPTERGDIRGCDPLGCGHFGASRSGGTRTHKGVDFIAEPGESIFAPISGKVTRKAYPYANDLSYEGIEIVNDQYIVKMFYMAPTIPVGSEVKAGQKIGVAQNISAKHGAAMTNHVHYEVYDRKTGKLLDPTKMFLPVLNYNLLLKKGMFNTPEVEVLQGMLGIEADGDFGQLTENALVAAKGVKQITLKQL